MLSLYVGMAISLMVLDHRFHYLEWMRVGLGSMIQPMQVLAQMPLRATDQASEYFSSVGTLQVENAALKRHALENSASLSRVEQLEMENERLRRLLGARDRLTVGGDIATILYAARDPFSRRVMVDRGAQQNVSAGQPVLDDAGVIGQVTRVYPMTAEVTLITDKDQAVPVQVVRNGLRSVIFGLGNGQLELRYMPANADIQNGDLLVTSGLDGIYPAGFPVAKVIRIEREASFSFARIICAPVGGVEQFTEVLILKAKTEMPERAAEIDRPTHETGPEKGNTRSPRARRAGKPH